MAHKKEVENSTIQSEQRQEEKVSTKCIMSDVISNTHSIVQE